MVSGAPTTWNVCPLNATVEPAPIATMSYYGVEFHLLDPTMQAFFHDAITADSHADLQWRRDTTNLLDTTIHRQRATPNEASTTRTQPLT